MARVFIIRSFDIKKDKSGKEIDFEKISNDLIEPARIEAGLDGGTTGKIIDAGNIREDMFTEILKADLVICDVTVHNANVFYELGVRHALRKRRTVLIKGKPTEDRTPFDIQTDRYLEYDIHDPSKAKDSLVDTINATMASDRDTDSPIFKTLSTLPEADPDKVRLVPSDFVEEVERARAAGAKGWLRLLASELSNRRFRGEGLRIVANAQLNLKDYEGARKSWEEIQNVDRDNVSANFALSNIYERLYRTNEDPELLELSTQAISRALEDTEISRAQQAEALALKGRNQKTLWRLEFENLAKPEERREKATNRTLVEAYESYRKAFLEDLNHFWSGLAAMQMGKIALELSETEDWEYAFNDEDEANNYKKGLKKHYEEELQFVVPMSINAALKHLKPNDENRAWAEISNADVLFLSVDKPKRVIRAYEKAIPLTMPFAWDSARRQLNLFSSLGINKELADEVIRVIDLRFEDRAEKSGGEDAAETDKGLHLILFAGHRVDETGRKKQRFPADRVDQAEALIRKKLEEVTDNEQHFEALSSAAPGSDILFHEICAEMGIKSKICLPMPKDIFASKEFDAREEWRTRFLDLAEHHDLLVLSDREGLPRWLHDSKQNPWERGNQWVLEMALTQGAKRITLIALWDGENRGDDLGGTAHMWQIAGAKGIVNRKRIDAKELTA